MHVAAPSPDQTADMVVEAANSTDAISAERAVAFYASTIVFGLFDDRVLEF